MGVKKIRRQILAVSGVDSKGNIGISTNAGYLEDVETVTATGTISAYGVSFISGPATTADTVFTLPVPPKTGLRKQIIVKSTEAKKVTVQIGATTSVGHLYGLSAASTLRQIVFSTNTTKVRSIELIARSTSQWGVLSKSTAVTFIA